MKRNIILTSFIVFVVSLIFLQIGVLPQYRQYAQLRSQLKTTRQTLANKKEYYAQLFTVEQKLNSHSEALAKINSALPVLPDTAALYQLVQQKAGESGLIIENFSGLEISNEPNKKTGLIKFSAILNGDYPSLVSFLKAIEKSSRLVNVKSVILKPIVKTGQTTKKAEVPSYVLTFTAHYYQGI